MPPTYRRRTARSIAVRAPRWPRPCDVCADADRRERTKVGLRAKVVPPFRGIERRFGDVKVRYRGLAENTAQALTQFVLSNPWLVRRRLMPAAGALRL